MTTDADLRAPGAAVTLALCGGWEHEPPCPLAAHHTSTHQSGDDVLVTVLFAAEPNFEALARSRIVGALTAGFLAGPGGITTRWQLRHCRPRAPLPPEEDHLQRLIYG